MNEAGSSGDATAKSRATKGRRILILVFLTTTIPLVAAFILAQSGWRPHGARVNHGELLQPARPLPASTFQDPRRKPVTLDSLKGQWLLVTVAHGSCTVPCRSNLWKMQQVRLAQGQHMRRIDRVLIMDDRARTPAALVERDYPGTLVLTAKTPVIAVLAKVLADGDSAGNRIYLIDPNGNLVLRYPEGADGTGIRKDLARLLRLSRIG